MTRFNQSTSELPTTRTAIEAVRHTGVVTQKTGSCARDLAASELASTRRVCHPKVEVTYAKYFRTCHTATVADAYMLMVTPDNRVAPSRHH